MNDFITIQHARVNNLKNIDVRIPRDQFVVITGVSGSGKSSLAFDTLYAEGQRRYVESLSTYARQFLGRMAKPECDFIEGIPPAIAIEQKVIARNPRSTVGTTTEIYDYLRMLFARVGHTFSPVSGEEVKKHSIDDLVTCMLGMETGTRFQLLSPIRPHEGRTDEQQEEIYRNEGFTHFETIDGSPWLVVDRLVSGDDRHTIDRLMDSAHTALYEGDGTCALRTVPRDGTAPKMWQFSMAFEADGLHFEEPSDQLFSFNSPSGACPECEGFGRVVGIDESLVIPDQGLSVYDGAVMCWRGDVMSEWKAKFIRQSERTGFPIFTPYYALTPAQKDLLWHGDPSIEGTEQASLDAFFDMVQHHVHMVQFRVMLAHYRGKTLCPSCHGGRLRKEAGYVRVGGKTIMDLADMPVTRLLTFFHELKLSDHYSKVAQRLLIEIEHRLQFLADVGLSYLTLGRLSNTLSGGESQRINLATSLGSSLVGSLYILDEPSIGLHSRDTQRLIRVLRQLQQLGNTVVVVEHDEEIMRAADYIIDIGPGAGRLGGQIVWQGTAADAQDSAKNADIQSHTLNYLTAREQIEVPTSRRPWNRYITVHGARENNLKGIDVCFPLNIITVVTGVSGSGKSTLVRDILYPAVKRHLDEVCARPGLHSSVDGDLDAVQHIEFVDQNPIGTSTRSNPATYIGAYDEIRRLMAAQPLAKQMDYTPAFFSFNTEGGRCEECKGEGTVTIEMQFMNDLVLECESCHGKRFKSDILDVRYEGKNICDLLDMTVNQAVEFFTEHGKRRIVNSLRPLQDVGLGYLKLGQRSSTLSGGENQRVKLAYYLSQERAKPTLFIFDEPTTGLHFHDIRLLLDAFAALVSRGHTVLIIEHNLDVIKCADHVIDLGPEGGEAGGKLVACGTPEQVAQSPDSYTGQFLRAKLHIPADPH